MRTVLLLGLAREFMCQELDRTHGGDEVVHVVLREVTSIDRR